MRGCLAPSEVPSISPNEASVFGGIAEDLIWVDFCQTYNATSGHVFRDANNPAAYLYFLAWHNPHFTERHQLDYFDRVRGQSLMAIPDFLVHLPNEHAFYEVKPDSPSGFTAGTTKAGRLGAIYRYYKLPYRGGTKFQPRDHTIAIFRSPLRATLKVRLAGPGLILYKICLESDHTLDVTVLAALLAYIVRQFNKQAKTGRFRPVDLEPALASNQQLADVATALGLPLAVGAGAAVGWRYFWKAVAKRFAVRGATAATLAAADGPLPVGDLLAAGMAFWTILDVIRLSDQLWQEAETIARQGA